MPAYRRLAVARVHETLSLAVRRTAANVEVVGEEFPDFYEPAKDRLAVNGGWTEGFWTGILWRLYDYSKQERFREWAAAYTRELANRKAEMQDHDLGFLFSLSCVLQHAVTGDDRMLPHALRAAQRLAARFNPRGRFIRAHGDLSDPDRAGYAIIDTLMNLGLLFWAYWTTRDKSFLRIACDVARTIMREYLRPDGSSYQVVWFNPVTGAVVEKGTLQGYGPESCWARGQAFGVYGFAQAYLHTGDATFLDAASRMARFFVEHVPPDGVVFYDLTDPRIPNVPKDTSAQAVAAAGLLLLARGCTGQERVRWLLSAEALLAPLCDEYLAPDPPAGKYRGILREGCYFLARDRGVHAELAVGDYYLVEALMRYLAAVAWG